MRFGTIVLFTFLEIVSIWKSIGKIGKSRYILMAWEHYFSMYWVWWVWQRYSLLPDSRNWVRSTLNFKKANRREPNVSHRIFYCVVDRAIFTCSKCGIRPPYFWVFSVAVPLSASESSRNRSDLVQPAVAQSLPPEGSGLKLAGIYQYWRRKHLQF